MAEKTIEAEVLKALSCVGKDKNFILSGGAGSGKTYSLVSLLTEISEKYPSKSIVCITYTNNAVAEIRSRISNNNLIVSTIHEFVWNVIAKYQTEIKKILIELINDDEETRFKKPSELVDDEDIDFDFFSNKIEYDEYYSLKSKGRNTISHDHILIVAEKMFAKFPKLCDILKDTANFIFIDEYQDTSPLVIKIFLEHINKSEKKCIIGFFGDSMQAIYNDGVGKVEDSSLIIINKSQNRRNPYSVIRLANKLRDDGILQIPSEDVNAPNMYDDSIIEGSVKFVFIDDINQIEDIKKTDLFKDWEFGNSKKTKELWLTHAFNAEKAGFGKLYSIYHNDLIYELISKIKKKIKDGIILPEEKTFEKLVDEASLKKRVCGKNELIVDIIRNDCEYNVYYENLKNKVWEEISVIYINSDSLLSYKFNGLTGMYEAKPTRDIILKTLDNIYELLELYNNREYNSFLRKTKLQIKNYSIKKRLNDDMLKISNNKNKSIEEIISEVHDINLIFKNEEFKSYISHEGEYLWNRIKKLRYSEYEKSIAYQKEYLPFATQHSIKGSEFENVLVVLDSNWNQYDFRTLFGLGSNSENVIYRTRKLFYVCCTRAKKNLIVFMPTKDLELINKIGTVFEEDDIMNGNLLI